MDEKKPIIKTIVDLIEKLGLMYMTHPNDAVKLFAASMLVDNEICKRMTIINERNKENAISFVGHCVDNLSDPDIPTC